MGSPGAPAENWPAKPYSNVCETPAVREKPYIIQEGDGNYAVQVSATEYGRSGTSWEQPTGSTKSISLAEFYLARPGIDTATILNILLSVGQSIIFTTGIYELEAALAIVRPGTILLGLGLANLRPTQGTEAITVADVGAVHLAELLLEASDNASDVLCRIGDAKSNNDHIADPVVLSDVLLRVGGAVSGRANKMLVINVRHTIVDHTWVWRADHGAGVGWFANTCHTGLLVEADDAICCGLFVEHCQGYQTVWNGERGQVFFYQSEFSYDVPNQAVWSHAGVHGYASYKVASSVRHHRAVGLGIYCVFVAADNVRTFTAIEHPLTSKWQGVKSAPVKHATIVRFGGNPGTAIEHIINNQGGLASESSKLARLDDDAQGHVDEDGSKAAA